MFSLPLIHPQDETSLYLHPHLLPRSHSPPSTQSNQPQTAQQTHRQRQLREEEKRLLHARSPLALLAAEEANIAFRKSTVRNFGAHWIRPPGVPKTLQAQTEEEQDRLEQEEEMRRQQGIEDMQAQQQLQEARQAAEEAAAQDDGEEERDLDDEIPDADEEGEEEERDLDDEVPDPEATVGSLTFNEESLMEGSSMGDEAEQQQAEYDVGLEEAELTGVARDEEDLGMGMDRDLDAEEEDHGLGMERDLDEEEEEEEERNLDDSVPEAGSYQHTDTELEDTTDEESDLRSSFVGGRAVRTPALGVQPSNGLQERMRAQVQAADVMPRSPGTLNLSSSLLESSMLGSSPVLQRGHPGPRGRAARGRSGRMS